MFCGNLSVWKAFFVERYIVKIFRLNICIFCLDLCAPVI